MNTRRDYNIPFLQVLEGMVFGYCENIDTVAGEGLAEGATVADVPGEGVGLDFLD